jgi:4-amino-4-deoxy-L-arabinose transferase-like glycosyltransferase
MKRVAFWGLLFAICFFGVNRELWTPDEPREAEISREMFIAPSVVPSLNGETFVEKPPLYYWMVATVFAVLGEPSATAARGASALASFLTLVLVFLWGRRDFSPRIGYVAAFGLATSAQFMATSHWVLIDPLLTLLTTLALFMAAKLVRGERSRGELALFLGAMVLALWAKGFVGPALVVASLVAYAVARRSLEPLRRVYPAALVLILGMASAVFATLLYVESGPAAVREWFWTNHVQRFLNPTTTGHEQPFYYYFSAIPVAVLPWILPFVAALRPQRWATRSGAGENDRELFLGAACVGMALLLSASATKRSLYLLPMLPPLFVLLGSIASEWWDKRDALRSRARWWKVQLAVVAAFAAIPAAVGLVYLQAFNPLAVMFLTVVVAAWAVTTALTSRAEQARALLALGALAVGGILGWLGVGVHLAAPTKDWGPFVTWAGEQVPPSQPVYVVGDFDESVRGIVPFSTGRPAVSISIADVDRVRPRFVLVHMKDVDHAPSLEPAYRLVDGRLFGPDRYMALWQRRDQRDHSASY